MHGKGSTAGGRHWYFFLYDKDCSTWKDSYSLLRLVPTTEPMVAAREAVTCRNGNSTAFLQPAKNIIRMSNKKTKLYVQIRFVVGLKQKPPPS